MSNAGYLKFFERFDGEAPHFDGQAIYAISDLHVDSKVNRDWVDSLPAQDHLQDALIVAGDVATNLEVLESTLFALLEKFGAVWFCPGNHELWCSPDKKGQSHSIEKYATRLLPKLTKSSLKRPSFYFVAGVQTFEMLRVSSVVRSCEALCVFDSPSKLDDTSLCIA